MAATSPQDITQLLKAWNNGEQEALDQLIPLVYHELHRLAQLDEALKSGKVDVVLADFADLGAVARFTSLSNVLTS